MQESFSVCRGAARVVHIAFAWPDPKNAMADRIFDGCLEASIFFSNATIALDCISEEAKVVGSICSVAPRECKSPPGPWQLLRARSTP